MLHGAVLKGFEDFPVYAKLQLKSYLDGIIKLAAQQKTSEPISNFSRILLEHWRTMTNSNPEANTSVLDQDLLPGPSVADLVDQRRQRELLEKEAQLVGSKENRARHKRLQHLLRNYNHFKQEYPISAIVAYGEKRGLDGQIVGCLKVSCISYFIMYGLCQSNTLFSLFRLHTSHFKSLLTAILCLLHKDLSTMIGGRSLKTTNPEPRRPENTKLFDFYNLSIDNTNYLLTYR